MPMRLARGRLEGLTGSKGQLARPGDLRAAFLAPPKPSAWMISNGCFVALMLISRRKTAEGN